MFIVSSYGTNSQDEVGELVKELKVDKKLNPHIHMSFYSTYQLLDETSNMNIILSICA